MPEDIIAQRRGDILESGGNQKSIFKNDYSKQVQASIKLNLESGAKRTAKSAFLEGQKNNLANNLKLGAGLSALKNQRQVFKPIRITSQQSSKHNLFRIPLSKQATNQSNKFRDIFMPAFTTKTVSKSATRQIQLPSLALSQVQMQEQSQRQAQALSIDLVQVQKQILSKPRPHPIKIPKTPFTPPPPIINLPQGERRKRKSKSFFAQMKRPYRYTSSLRAVVFKIKGKKPRIITGVSIRPLLR